MQLTIKTKLFGLAAGSLLLVAGVSATGYWGITSVTKTTAQVGAPPKPRTMAHRALNTDRSRFKRCEESGRIV